MKRVRTSISTSDNSDGNLPGDGLTISCLGAVSGSADFGAEGFVRGSSDKIGCYSCLDIRYSTWDDAKSSVQNTFTTSALDNSSVVNMQPITPRHGTATESQGEF